METSIPNPEVEKKPKIENSEVMLIVSTNCIGTATSDLPRSDSSSATSPMITDAEDKNKSTHIALVLKFQ